MLSEISQSQVDNTIWFHLYGSPRGVKFKETESKIMITRGWSKVDGELVFLKYLLRKSEGNHKTEHQCCTNLSRLKKTPILQTLSIVNMWKLPYIWANVLTAAKNSLSRKKVG